ncbi:hypothetical protein ASPFODRAFT_716038 [Aspergillus luchuensis CBS 106.47]|uniref:Uncharacterized protein n=1 Tax=Aspergillus luchuensis (strain CBS 106.47) TaxID=1137211 RepID=A0A1M3SYK9_ASPLC|nr:hypothetical protein ASPFODRAFT_716038 [Aspergillus luchuensis CBS 106.47]
MLNKLTLTALATIIRSLMATGAGQDRWSSEIQSSFEDLTVKSLDELMKLMSWQKDGTAIDSSFRVHSPRL